MDKDFSVVAFLEELGRLAKESVEEWLNKEPAEVVDDPPKAANFEEQRKALESHLPSGYSFVAESRDGKLCLFQDKDGHLCVVNSSKFV